MSLLMDALKKAEEAKRAAGEGRTSETSTPRELELAPLETPATETSSAYLSRQTPASTAATLPELSLHLESVDADLAAVSTQRPDKHPLPKPATAPSSHAAPKATNGSPKADSERAAVRNVFSAKQPAEDVAEDSSTETTEVGRALLLRRRHLQTAVVALARMQERQPARQVVQDLLTPLIRADNKIPLHAAVHKLLRRPGQHRAEQDRLQHQRLILGGQSTLQVENRNFTIHGNHPPFYS